jgi:hypothetical protein
MNESSSLTAMERGCFDALAAISYALTVGMIGAVTIRANHGATMISLLPKDFKTAKPEENKHFAAGSITDAIKEAGDYVDHAIHLTEQDGADIQPYHQHKAAARELRKKPLIVVPRN